MRQSEQINDLAAALSVAQGQIENVTKDTANTFFKSKYATLASVLEAIREPFSKAGLSVIQMPCMTPEGSVFLVTRLMHKSGQYTEGDYPIKPVKDDPQGIGSAITYARRYALMAVAGVAPEDDDGNAASGRSEDPKANRQQAKQAATAVAEQKLAAVPEKPVVMSRDELAGWLPRATRAMINNALKDVGNRLDARYGTGYATALRSEALGVFKAAQSSELSDANAKLVLLQLYDDLMKPDDPKASGESPANELQEYLDGMTDVGSTVFAFKLLSDRLAKAIGSDAARNDYHAILEKQGVKHSNEFKGKGMDAKAKAALTELYHLVVKEEQVPA